MSFLREIAPNDPCDRCGHPSKHHAPARDGSFCTVGGRGRGKLCPCDGFFPVPPKAAKA